MFFYYQHDGGHEKWRHELLSSRSEILKKLKPRFITALAVSRPIDSDTPKEELEKLKYLGPFYVDFDAKDGVEAAIPKLNQFLDKLEQHDVSLKTLSIYATGGRGFHVEIPPETFLTKLPKDGIPNLPYIYKEIAYKLFVETLDLRVYTAKRGRMWRTPNVERENGMYKVPISLAEAREMTLPMYLQLCSAPRQYLSAAAYEEVQDDQQYVCEPTKPAQALGMVRLYAEAQIKVNDGAKRRKKSAKQTEGIIRKFKGEFPPTLMAMMANQHIKPSAGWNQIAMQIAIVANELGKDHDEVVETARPLIDGHSGDSKRYGTPREREEELRNQLAYTNDNPCYTYSPGAIKVLLESDVPAVDLEGVQSEELASDIAQARLERASDDASDDGFDKGVAIGVSGITQRIDGEWVTWTKAGFDRVSMLINANTGRPIAFHADVYYRGVMRGRTTIPLESFLSRQKFHALVTAETGGTFFGNDGTVQAIQEAFVLKARAYAKEHGVEFVIRQEGLNLVQFPANVPVPEIASEPFPVWSSPFGCLVPKRIADAGLTFRFYGEPNPDGISKTDLMLAPELKDTPQLRRVMEAVFKMNRPRTVGPMLGWLVACNARMYYHLYKNQFPLLGIAGEQGAGKSTTLLALSKLHFYRKEMPDLQVLSSTPTGIEKQIMSSCSVPIHLEEYKPRDMSPEKLGRVRAVLRGAYNNGTVTKGGGAQVQLTGAREVTETSLSGPVAFVGEALESESAIVERTVQCVFEKGGRKGRQHHLDLLQREGSVLASVGRQIVSILLGTSYSEFCDSFDKDYKLAQAAMPHSDNARICFNTAVALHGLTMLEEVLISAGIRMPEEFQEVREAVLLGPVSLGESMVREDGAAGESPILVSKSEAAKVLSQMALMSMHGSMHDNTLLKEGQDYAFTLVGGSEVMEVSLPLVWDKYEEYCGRKRRPPLYDTLESFSFGMKNFAAYFDSSCAELNDAPGVVRFRCDRLLEAQVTPFKRS